jgi:plastocyanin
MQRPRFRRLACASFAAIFSTTCNLVWNADDYTFDDIACQTVTDCPGADSGCQVRACSAGRCTLELAPAGTPASAGAQIPGDCQTLMCDASGNATPSIDDADVPDDGLDCTIGSCSDGMPDSAPAPTGTPCGDAAGSMCDGEGSCLGATCFNGQLDDDESDVDCGGACAPCHGGSHCNVPSDCDSGVCIDMVCKYPNCSDGIHNGDETDVDCGGPCNRCPDGAGCAVADDCESGVCTAGECVAGSCADSVKNGAETDVDCGGGVCQPCVDGMSCALASDCSSGFCTLTQCVPAICADSVLNGSETDTDCGGPACAPCLDGENCLVASDCVSGSCIGNICQMDACNDGIQNGNETGIDCGGPMCAPCPVGAGCTVNSDCVTTVCLSNTCAPLNGCNPVTAANHTGTSSVNINFQGTGNSYLPPCIRVSVGTSVVFNGNFNAHPLEGGKVVQGVNQYDATSPFSPVTASGTSKSFTMTTPGMYPYYCVPHYGGGMFGTVFVE